MNTERYLIEQAAVAAGLHEHGWMADSYMHVVNSTWHVFAPDKHRQEAQQLAEQLGIELEWEPGTLVRAFVPEVWFPKDAQFRCTERFERYDQSSEDAAVCRAVVRAAACIGRAILGGEP